MIHVQLHYAQGKTDKKKRILLVVCVTYIKEAATTSLARYRPSVEAAKPKTVQVFTQIRELWCSL